MEVLLELLVQHVFGTDTDLVDLLPLVVLAYVVVGVRYLRAMNLELLKEIRALREHVNLTGLIRQLADRNAGGEQDRQP